jgi:UDP-glucose 4-epimerase
MWPEPPSTPEERLSDQRVLVTGATGFLGAPLSFRLRRAGAEVHAVSRVPRADRADGLCWWRLDMADFEAVRNLFDEVKPTTVFHLGGRVTAAPGLDLVQSTFHSLLASTVNLLTAAAQVGCRRVVVTGSLEEPLGNSAEPIPSSPYAAAKWAANGYARMFHRLYETPVVIVRPFFTYGPAQPEHRVIPYTILSYLRGGRPKLSSGQRRLDWVYVDDVIDGLLLAGSRPAIEGATIDLGSGEPVSVRDVVIRIRDLLGSSADPDFGAEPDRPLSAPRGADIGAAFSTLGWRAVTTLDAGLACTVEWYRRRFVATRVDAGERGDR